MYWVLEAADEIIMYLNRLYAALDVCWLKDGWMDGNPFLSSTVSPKKRLPFLPIYVISSNGGFEYLHFLPMYIPTHIGFRIVTKIHTGIFSSISQLGILE